MTTHPLLHAVETIVAQDGRRDFRLFLQFRPGRGVVDNPKATVVGTPGHLSYGFLMHIQGEDGLVECVGSPTEPLPIEVYAQAASERGLTVINLDERGQIVNGQVLWIDYEEPQPKPSATRQIPC